MKPNKREREEPMRAGAPRGVPEVYRQEGVACADDSAPLRPRERGSGGLGPLPSARVRAGGREGGRRVSAPRRRAEAAGRDAERWSEQESVRGAPPRGPPPGPSAAVSTPGPRPSSRPRRRSRPPGSGERRRPPRPGRKRRCRSRRRARGPVGGQGGEGERRGEHVGGEGVSGGGKGSERGAWQASRAPRLRGGAGELEESSKEVADGGDAGVVACIGSGLGEIAAICESRARGTSEQARGAGCGAPLLIKGGRLAGRRGTKCCTKLSLK